MPQPAFPLVAVFNSSEDVITILTQLLEEEGIRVVSDYIVPYRRGQRDIADFFAKHQVHAVVYDLAPPYDVNWNFFQTVRAASSLRPCAFVLTTANKGQLENLVGPTKTFEFVGKPFDLDRILEAVKLAMACHVEL